MEKNIDMHIHSTYSDGELNLEEIVKGLKENNVGIFSITDHDNIESSKNINNINLDGLEYYSGVEISSIYNGYKMHILGYNYELTTELEKLINEINEKRIIRFINNMDYIRKNKNVNMSDSEIETLINSGITIGRPNIVSFLLKHGYGESRKDAYLKYVKDYKNSVIYRADLENVIDILKKSNAKIILAHPKKIEKDYNIDIEEILPELVKLGIDGVEIFNNIHTLYDVNKYRKLSEKYNLLMSCGSDYHGINVKPDVILGGCSREKTNVKTISLVNKLRIDNK